MPLIEVISRVNRIHRWMIRERLLLSMLSSLYWRYFIYLLADMAIWNSHHSIFYPALGELAWGLILWIYRKEIP